MPPAARLLLGSFIGVAASGAAAEPVELIRSNGPDENRINIAVLGDGYTREELTDYADDVDRLLAEFFDNQPFTDYTAYFNVRRVDVTSNESGVDHPARDEYRDTALGAYYDCADIERLVCIDHAAVLDALDRSLAVDVRDIVMVLVNDDEYGGSGGAFPVASTNQYSAGIMLHEVGHSFGLLADEYSGGGPECDDSVEPPEVNVTRESTGAKWSHWIEPGTPVPATDERRGVVSAYEGAKYCDTGLYRPTFSSKMREVESPFEQVNTEQLIRRIYNLVSPIDAFSPTAADLQSDRCETLVFSVRTPGDVLPGTIAATWSIDGQAVHMGGSLTVATCMLRIGPHRVEVEVRDTTPAVRQDLYEVLVERVRWDLETSVTSLDPRSLFTDDPIQLGVTPIKAVHFTELRMRIGALRAAAGLSPFSWTDPVLQAGVTPIRLVHLLELREALGAAYEAAGRAVPRWTDAAPVAGSTAIRAAHLTELRALVIGIE